MKEKFRTMLTWCLESFSRSLPKLQYYVTTSKEIICSCLVVVLGLVPLRERVKKVEICLIETRILQIGLRLPSDFSSTMYLYWKQMVTQNYYGVKYSLYVANVSFRNVFGSFRNVSVAQSLVANITFQEEVFKLEQLGK